MEDNAQKIRIQDDLYQAVNGDWLKTAVIPSDRSSTGGFAILDQEVEKELLDDFDKLSKKEEATDIPEMKEAVKLYEKCLDVTRRDKDGVKPILPYLSKILALKNIDDLNKNAYELMLLGVDLPFNFGVESDMKDATKNSFCITGPSIILPDTTYYQDNNPSKEKLLSVYSSMAKRALDLLPLTEDLKENIIKDALHFDSLIAKEVKSELEWANYVDNYNPMDVKEVCDYLRPFDFKGLLSSVYGEKIPEQVIVFDPKATKNFRNYFNETTFIEYVHWAYLKYLLGNSSLLSQDLYAIGRIYSRTLSGVSKDPVLKKQAYLRANSVFSEPVGVYYGRKYFGEEAKKDVVSMVKEIIEMYKEKMKKNTFLNEKTKEKAILKLDSIVIKMGYPDKIDEYYSKLKIDENRSLFENMLSISKFSILHNLEKLNKPVDRTLWGMPGNLVNACYNPSSNDITFPAAILQKPFYSLKQSKSENLGGIGAVIGHEISHAFDNNGAQFDEKGNLCNWWSKDDYEAFKALTEKMVREWDGLPFHGEKVNGRLIVSENIADNGGLSVTLSIMHTMKDADYQAFFINWARIWCMKAKEEYIKLLLTNDVHAPCELRANIQPRNFAEWYKAFDVKETDGMYIPEEKRVVIW